MSGQGTAHKRGQGDGLGASEKAARPMKTRRRDRGERLGGHHLRFPVGRLVIEGIPSVTENVG
jgi:hypothetical protein